MRWLVWLLLAFAVAVGLSLLLRFNQGNVAIMWPPYRIDISVNLALALLAAGFVVLHLVLVAAARALGLPQRVRDYRTRRQQDQAGAALRDTLLAYFEGRMGRAERFARNAQASRDTAAPAALIAARAAHRMNERERRDQWLAEVGADQGAASALQMTQAELAVDDRRSADAIEILERLQAGGARHIVAMRTALRAYEQAERWDEVIQTLRLVEKRDALHPSAVRSLRLKAHTALMRRKAGDAVAIRTHWRSLRADERADADMAAATATALIEAGADEDARRIIEQGLDANCNGELIKAYGRVSGISLRDRLEGWRRRYGDDPDLLLTLGRVCANDQLWGKAEDYLRLALARQASVGAHLALADLFESLGRNEEAAAQFRLAARMAADTTPPYRAA
jgi:HemY protein